MERELYDIFARVDNTHWWFVGYRRIVETVIRKLKLPAGSRILEAGCGNGSNLPMLSQFGEVYASEMDGQAVSRAQAKGVAKVVKQEALPACSFEDNFFDLISLFEVLEHVEHDQEALIALRPKLKDGGRLLLTVPAFPWLWSHHDVANHHFRRYTKQSLNAALLGSGYRVSLMHYINFWLFPMALLVRLSNKFTNTLRMELKIPPRWLNQLLTWIFSSERFFVNTTGFPFGFSLVAVATRNT